LLSRRRTPSAADTAAVAIGFTGAALVWGISLVRRDEEVLRDIAAGNEHIIEYAETQAPLRSRLIASLEIRL
jgi:hypothetical protein